MIEIIKPEFQAGNEKRFFDFISNLNERDKIALVSHTDVDGISAAKIVNEVLQADLIYFRNYNQINYELVEKLKAAKINKLVITDIILNEYIDIINEINKFAEILIIDHHVFSSDLNSDRITFISGQGYCATYLAYYLFSRTQNIERLDWLVACASIADYFYQKNIKWIRGVYEKYGDKFEEQENYVRKSGVIWDLQWTLSLALIYFNNNLKKVYDSINGDFGEINDLKKYAYEVNNYLDDCFKKFEEEKIDINGRIFWEFIPKFKVASIISTIVSAYNIHKTYIICREDGELYSFSARRQDKKENMNLLLKKLVLGLENAEGGGHVPAAGGHVMLKDKEEFKKRLRELPEKLDF